MMAGCTYIFHDGARLELSHFPGRKKPIMVLTGSDGYEGHAVFRDEESMQAFIALFDRILRHHLGKQEDGALAGEAAELIRDMLADNVERATCLNLETGERFMFECDAEEIDGWKERMRALGIEVD